MASNFGEKKKQSGFELIPYAVAAVAVIIIATWFGYILEDTATKKGVQWLTALNSISDYANPAAFLKAFGAVFTGSGIAKKGLIFGFMGGMLIILWKFAGNGKRYHRKGVEHGSARWGNKQEKNIIADTNDFYNNVIVASDVFLVLDRKKREQNAEDNSKKTKKKNTKGQSPMGSSNENRSEIYSLQNEKISLSKIAEMRKETAKIKPMLNLNMVVLGGSGTGKSRFYVKPNIMQCNTSFVVTDPSGELLQSCGKMLERKGYRIKVFNINDMKHSSNYNPFHYLKDNNGNVSSNNVIKMINTFMLNTKEEGAGTGDQFWTDATRLLLSSLCFLLVETASEDEQNFAAVLDLIHKAKVIEGKEEEKSDLDLMFDKRKEAEPNALSVQYYEEFKQAAGKTMQSILISTTTKLQCFKLEDVRNLTFSDNIHLETMGDELTALFIIIPSTDTTYNFMAAMMYTQLFDALYNRAITYYHGRLKYHVRCLLDEFANCGKIPEFDKVLATCRKFEISAVIILQNLSQLKRLYEKSWEELPGNCDTMIYLGGKDQFTNEYLSKELGKETIDQQSVNQTKGKQGSSSYNNAILGRELATIDELSTMDNNDCIVMVRGLHPFMTAKFDIQSHPRYNMLDEANKPKNTYYLEDNIKTIPETEYVDFSRFYDNGTIDPDNTIEIGYVTSDNEIIKSAADLMSDITQDIRDIFSDITGVYAA
ncbi:MAG: type IV secretory system conjugative DNA transfer family protein [Oscillospiraceae bacterium]|nr:type IV secretory system conjugative DNA transfer family protein [Oscillospiraceae bacterium]